MRMGKTENMKRWLFSLFAALCVMLCGGGNFSSATVLAAAEDYTYVLIGSEDITKDEKKELTTDSGGKVTWDAEGGILTLEDVDLADLSSSGNVYGIVIERQDTTQTVTIKVRGTNTIGTETLKTTETALYANCNLVIELEEGSQLNILADSNNSSEEEPSTPNAIYTPEQLTITGTGSADLTSYYPAICATKQLTIEGVKLNTKATAYNAAIFSEGNITIHGQTAEITAAAPSIAIWSYAGEISIKDARIEASSTGHSAIGAPKGIDITGAADIKITGDQENNQNPGIYACYNGEGSLNISGSSTLDITSYGSAILSMSDINISGNAYLKLDSKTKGRPALSSYKGTKISENSKLDITAIGHGISNADADSYQVRNNTHLQITDNAIVTAKTADSTIANAEGAIIISGNSVVRAESSGAHGIFSYASITKEDGQSYSVLISGNAIVDAENTSRSSEQGNGMAGIYALDTLQITDNPTVTAKGGYALYCHQGDINLLGGTVTAEDSDYGIYAKGDTYDTSGKGNVTISNSNIAVSVNTQAIKPVKGTIFSGMPVIASANSSGASPEKFNAENHTTYKWLTTEKGTLSQPANLAWKNGVAEWTPTANATGYKVQLYKDSIAEANKVGQNVEVSDAAYDFGSAMKKSGNYFFTVKAVDSEAYFTDSDDANSSAYAYTCDHSGGTATCIDSAVCDSCGESYGKADADNHKSDEKMYYDSTGHWHRCSSCGEKVDSTTHTPGAAATETTPQICTVCSYEIKPMSGHTHKGGTATCISAAICTDCGKSYGDKDGKNHMWDQGKVTKKATATEKGQKKYTCTVCGTTKTEVIAATGVPAKGKTLTDSKTTAKYKVTKSGKTGGTVEYNKTTDENAKIITIPATVKIDGITYKVTSVAAKAFKGNTKITKATIGSNVKTIGKEAFSGCKNLKTVTFGKNVTDIKASAFANCTKLSSVTLNANLKTIGDKAFYKCTVLTKITIPDNVTKIGKQAFYNCTKLKTITIQTTKLNEKTVGDKAFTGTPKNAKVKVPYGKADAYQKLLVKKGLNKKASFIKVVPEKGTVLTDTKAKAEYKITKAGAKNGTVEYTKSTNAKAKTITIPATVKIDGITYKVTSIAENAFKGNTKITKVTIGSNISKVGKQAFYGCKNLKSITIKSTKLTDENVGSKAFTGTNKKVTVKVPAKKLSAYKKLLKQKGISSTANVTK